MMFYFLFFILTLLSHTIEPTHKKNCLWQKQCRSFKSLCYESTFCLKNHSYFPIWIPLKSIALWIFEKLTMLILNLTLCFQFIQSPNKLLLWQLKQSTYICFHLLHDRSNGDDIFKQIGLSLQGQINLNDDSPILRCN